MNFNEPPVVDRLRLVLRKHGAERLALVHGDDPERAGLAGERVEGVRRRPVWHRCPAIRKRRCIKRVLRGGLALSSALLLVGCGGDEPRGDLLIRAERLFDGERMLSPGAVLIRDEEILAVGGELEAKSERTLDLGDATILPGFIDLHVHVTESELVTRGVTTVRNLGAPLDMVRPMDERAELRVLFAGPLITAPGGYPIPIHGRRVALELRGERRARAAVRDLARRGAALIKIALDSGSGWPMLTVHEVRALVDEAHGRDLRVAAHVSGRLGVDLALAGGVDELAHMPCGGIGSDVLRGLAERDVEIVATLHVTDIYGHLYYCADPTFDARRFVELGGRLLYGSDLGVAGIPFGIDVKELRLMRRAGLSAEDVLAAATSRAGEHIGLAPLGTLAEGAPADVIGVAGDARRLGDDLARPLLVVRAGRLVAGPRAGDRP